MFHKLPEGDVLIHAGDCTNVGKEFEVKEFVEWFQNIKGFDTKIFIAGNHDFAFERRLEPHHKGDYDWLYHLINEENLSQSDVTYLEDNFITIQSPEFSRPIKIYGSPWQPEFYNWAFNLPRQGDRLRFKWDSIPDDTDILITHGPAYGFLDDVEGRRGVHLGCELLANRIETIRPKIHVCGHIHSGRGHYWDGHTHFFNASVLDEQYSFAYLPHHFDWNEITNEIKWLHY
jgi:hypothetical protein